MRKDRKHFPKDLAAAAISKGESIFSACPEEKVLAVKFRALNDKSTGEPKIVHMLTTSHYAKVAPTGKKDKNDNLIMKPTCTIEYNHKMGGIDVMDQQLHTFHTTRKAYKWSKKAVLHMLMPGALSSHKFINSIQDLKTIS